MTTLARPVAVEELRRAWHAVQDGAFGPTATVPPVQRSSGTAPLWDPLEHVLPVVGVIPQAGASALALAVATVCGGRVVECCTATASGLGSAATAEMGSTPGGWVVGRRDGVHIARTSAIHRCVDEVPLPEDALPGTTVSVLDVGWDLGQVLTGDGWLNDALRRAPAVLLVATLTVPGLRRLEVAADLLGADRVVVAARGPRRWARELRSTVGPTVRALHESDRWTSVPQDRELARRGLDSAPLPRPLLAAAQDLWRRCDAVGNQTKEHS
ncbi:MAG: hypothetical protein ACYCTH_00135 [Cellulomonas sp.]